MRKISSIIVSHYESMLLVKKAGYSCNCRSKEYIPIPNEWFILKLIGKIIFTNTADDKRHHYFGETEATFK